MTLIKKIMDFVDLVWHLAGFVAPAAVLSVAIVAFSRLLWRAPDHVVSVRVQLAAQLIVGCGVLLLGLILSGHDGRMTTYAALALVAGSLQWALRRGAKR